MPKPLHYQSRKKLHNNYCINIFLCFFFFFLTPAMQICHLYGKKNWSESLRPPRRPGWSKAQNGHDSVCLPYGQRHEESLKHKRLVLRPGIHPFDSLKLDALQRNTQGAHVFKAWMSYTVPDHIKLIVYPRVARKCFVWNSNMCLISLPYFPLC